MDYKLGIISAVETEIAPYIEALAGKRRVEYAGNEYFEGTLWGYRAVCVASGVCKVNAAIAACALIGKFGADVILVSGTAGGLDRNLRIADTVLSREVFYHDVEAGILTDYLPYMKKAVFVPGEELVQAAEKARSASGRAERVFWGNIVTGESFVEGEQKEFLFEKYGALCADMETAAIAHVCHMHNIPFLAVRSISDTLDEDGMEAFAANCLRASESAFETVKLILGNLS